MIFMDGEGMRQRNEPIAQKIAEDRLTYNEIMKPHSLRILIFRHDDQSTNKTLVHKKGGYATLLVYPDTQKESLQNMPKQVDQSVIGPRQQWAQSKIKHQISDATQAVSNEPKEAGWKFHLSVAQDEKKENLKKAWNALVPILLKYKVGETKIVKDELVQDANKAITVYTFNGGPKLDQWEPFLKEVESAFKEHGVVPGEEIYENHVTGSEYIYYRNDAGPNGEYVEDKYDFLYRVVDQIPISESKMLEFAAELKQTPNAVGIITKLKDSDTCFCHLRVGNDWISKEFKLDLLKNIENPNKPQLASISPLANREAYLELVVPELNIAISSTNNISKTPDPFSTIDFTPSLGLSKPI